MATQTRPFLMTGAALASAAAIAVASPAIAPNITPTPNALSAAQVELTTFADLMSIPSAEWSNVLFGENPWGGYVSASQTSGLVIQPYANTCDNQGGCYVGGISGVAYLALDALLNGDSLGYQPTYVTDPITGDPVLVPGTGYTGWKVSAVNYLFEPSYQLFLGNGAIFTVEDTLAGVSASTQYILQSTLGQLSPVISDLIFRAYLGFYNVTIAYDNILQIVAGAALNLPVLGGFVSNSILAYLGRLETDTGALYLQGLSGTLQYWLNLANGTEPWPGASTATAAAAAAPRVAAQVAAAVSSPLAAARSAAPEAGPSTPEVTAAEVEAPEAGDTTPAEDSSTESTPASAESTDSESTDSASTESASTESASDSTPAETPADTTPAVEASSSAVADSAPAATKGAEAGSRASKRPVRSAADRVTKKIASAVSGAVHAGKRISVGR